MHHCPNGRSLVPRLRATLSATAALAIAAPLAVLCAGPVAAQEVAAWRVECTGDGKTQRVTTYDSVPEALEAAGLLEPS